MKNVMTNLMIAAAAFAAVAGTASAQSLEAKIPFAFRAAGKVMPAGTYRVELRPTNSGARQLTVSAPKGPYHLLTFAYYEGQPSVGWQATGKAMLSFRCGVSRCALKEIWMGSDDLVYGIAVPKLGRDEPTHTAEIVLHTVKGD